MTYAVYSSIHVLTLLSLTVIHHNPVCYCVYNVITC